MLDANFNRSREGLRVCEDVCRFVLSSAAGASELRGLRHDITRIYKTFDLGGLLGARDAAGDTGRRFNAREKARAGWRDLYFANLQRSKESLRVLEEAAKLTRPDAAPKLKRLRFKLYEHEKNVFAKF